MNSRFMLGILEDHEAVLARFNKLMQELLRGQLTRNTFRPWEVDILLDIESCDLANGNRRELLRRYQRAVQRSMENGAPTPLKFSEYLQRQQRRG